MIAKRTKDISPFLVMDVLERACTMASEGIDVIHLEVGEPDFDKRIWVDCPDVAAAKAYLTPERRKAVMTVAELGAVVVGPGDQNIAQVSRQQRGYKPQREWLEERLKEFSAVAKQLDA